MLVATVSMHLVRVWFHRAPIQRGLGQHSRHRQLTGNAPLTGGIFGLNSANAPHLRHQLLLHFSLVLPWGIPRVENLPFAHMGEARSYARAAAQPIINSSLAVPSQRRTLYPLV